MFDDVDWQYGIQVGTVGEVGEGEGVIPDGVPFLGLFCFFAGDSGSVIEVMSEKSGMGETQEERVAIQDDLYTFQLSFCNVHTSLHWHFRSNVSKIINTTTTRIQIIIVVDDIIVHVEIVDIRRVVRIDVAETLSTPGAAGSIDVWGMATSMPLHLSHLFQTCVNSPAIARSAINNCYAPNLERARHHNYPHTLRL